MDKTMAGQRIRLTTIDDDGATSLQPGDEGTIQHLDTNYGVLLVYWDSSSKAGLIPGKDTWEVIYD